MSGRMIAFRFVSDDYGSPFVPGDGRARAFMRPGDEIDVDGGVWVKVDARAACQWALVWRSFPLAWRKHVLEVEFDERDVLERNGVGELRLRRCRVVRELTPEEIAAAAS